MTRYPERILLVLVLISVTFLCSFGQSPEAYISLHLKNQTYQKGKLMEIDADYYFLRESGELIIHGRSPKEYIKTSNKFGEVKVYFPEDNSVSIKQNELFSSQNELLYYFLSNNYSDLGLSKENYKITDTIMDGKHQVVTWVNKKSDFPLPKIELVFDNDKPIYAAYYNSEDKIVRKIYYYNYEFFQSFMMPKKVTQISYPATGDSVIQRNTYSNLKITSLPSSQYFNFKVPDNAKILD